MAISPFSMLHSTYSYKVTYTISFFWSYETSETLVVTHNAMQEMFFSEDHPLAVNISFAIGLGLLPVTFSLKTVGCGIKNSGLPEEEAGDVENSSNNYPLLIFYFIAISIFYCLVVLGVVFLVLFMHLC